MLASSLALVIPALVPAQIAGSVTEPNLVEVLALQGEPSPFIDGNGAAWLYDEFHEIATDPDGGWLARAEVASPQPPIRTWLLIGQRASELDGPVNVFRTPPSTSPGDLLIYDGALAEGRVISIEGSAQTGLAPHAVRIDGQPFLTRLDAVAGAPGWTWDSFSDVVGTRGGGIFLTGEAVPPTPAQPQEMLIRADTGVMLMNGLDFVPGLNRRIANVTDVWASPSGTHWISRVVLRTTAATAVVLDGATYEVEPGHPLITDEPLPPSVSSVLGAGTWESLNRVMINDEGDVAVTARVLVGGERFSITLLNGVLIGSSPAGGIYYGMGLTAEGLVVETDLSGEVRTPRTVIAQALAGVDLDRDGTPDGGFALQRVRFLTRVFGDAPIHAVGLVSPTVSGQREAILRARRPNASTTTCGGVPNSTGAAGSLVAVGSPLATSNELALEVYQLPGSAPGYALFSRTSAAPTQPLGSSGEICLGGSIGRLLSGLFVTSSAGTGGVTLDLTALPQPTGAVPAMAGDTWYAQVWHRDAIGASATSNFTDAIKIDFL